MQPRSPKPPRRALRAASGFTLMSVLVAMLIVAILTTLGVMSYRQIVTRSSLKVGQAALLQQAQDLEQFAQDHDTYVGGCAQPVAADGWQLSCSGLAVGSYTVRATGQGAAAGFVFTLDQTGARTTSAAPSGWPTSTACWIIDSSGNCAHG